MTFRCARLIVLIGLFAGIGFGSQEHAVSENRMPERVIGLLELREIYGEFPCQLFAYKKVELYATASKDRAPIGVIELLNPPRPPERPDCDPPNVVVRRPANSVVMETLPSDEIGYEMQATVVYERRGRWFRIALPSGSAWIERDTEMFFSYPGSLVSDDPSLGQLTYLRKGWDGKLWSEPGNGTSKSAPPLWQDRAKDNITVHVIDVRTVRGEMWVRVRFLTDPGCGEPLGNLPPLDGWIPAYRDSKSTSVWFYSRGC